MNDTYLRIILYIIIFIIVIISIIITHKLEYNKARKKVMKENTFRIAHKTDFIICIISYIRESKLIKDLLNSGYYASFDIFYEMVKDILISQFKKDYESNIEFIPNTTIDNPLSYINKFPYFDTFNSKLNVFEEAINSLEIENELLRMYSSRFEEGIKEAEEIEKEAIAYNKTFGNEPSGDPKLHPTDNAENVSDAEEDINENELFDKLISSGTVEEFEDDNLKEF